MVGATGISDAHPLAPLCPRHMHGGRSSLAPAAAASRAQFLLCSEEAVGLDELSAPPDFNTVIAAFIELRLSAEWCLKCGRGGSHPGRRSQTEPAASSWPRDGRAQSGHRCPWRSPCQAQLPGCHSKDFLLVALWRGSGVLVLEYIGLYMKMLVPSLR